MMPSRFAIAFAILFVLLLNGCATPRTVYDAPLVNVRRPADVEARWGAYRIQPTDTTGYNYSDELIHMVVVPSRGTFTAMIENKTEHTLQLVWDEGAYVGPTGLSSRIVNGDQRVIDMERAQPPTVIPAHASALLNIVPTELYHERNSANLTNYMEDFVSVCGSAEDYEGRSLRLVLPIRVQDTVNEYTLDFRLTNVQIPKLNALNRRNFCGG